MHEEAAKELLLLLWVQSKTRIHRRVSSRKGNEFENEIATYLSDQLTGLKVSRTPMSGGGFTDIQMPDVYGTPDVWVEAKRTERLAVYPAMSQAEAGIAERQAADMPVVISRKNRMPTEESLVVMRLKDWTALYKTHLERSGYLKGTTE